MMTLLRSFYESLVSRGFFDDREMVVHQWMEEGTVSYFWAKSMW